MLQYLDFVACTICNDDRALLVEKLFKQGFVHLWESLQSYVKHWKYPVSNLHIQVGFFSKYGQQNNLL